MKDLISFKHIGKRLFIIFPLDLPSPLLSKRCRPTSENKGSNVLLGIIT